MNNLVIGRGEVGRGVAEVLECPAIDMGDEIPKADILHICFPYSEEFEKEVRRYKTETGAKYVVIHSTVPVGTSRKVNAVHSPIRGRHPNLAESIRTFVKFFGGKDAEIVSEEFVKHGVECILTDKPENTEAMKLFDTEQYHLNILMEKAIYEFCKEHDLDYDVVYTQANATYNEGYARLGMPWFTKYVLKHEEGPIGGHCVVSNSKILSLLDMIKSLCLFMKPNKELAPEERTVYVYEGEGHQVVFGRIGDITFGNEVIRTEGVLTDEEWEKRRESNTQACMNSLSFLEEFGRTFNPITDNHLTPKKRVYPVNRRPYENKV